MTKKHSKREGHDEMDLGEILRELYGRKWLLLALTLAVGVTAAVITLTMPNVYESSAVLIIRQPQRAVGLDPESPTTENTPALSVETVQTLTESTEIVWTVFEDLWAEQALEEWKNGTVVDKEEAFRGFQTSLNTEVMTQKGRAPGGAVALLPILVLKARANSPAEAQTIANAWALLAEEESRGVYTESVEAASTFIGTMYTESNDALAKYEQTLAEKTIEAALDLKEVRLDAVKNKSTGLEEAIFDLNTEIAVSTAAIKEGERRIAEQQHEEEWIGTVAEGMAIMAAAYPFDKESLSPQARKIVGVAERRVGQAESLRTYKKEQNLLGLQKEFDHYQLQLARILAEKAKVDDELPSVQAALQALSDLMETIPEKITLDKAITDDALWNAYVNNALPKNEALVPLKTEIVNPLHESTGELVVEMTAEVETLKGSSEQLAKSAKAATQSIADLESEVDAIAREIERRQNELEATDAVLTLLREDYLAEMKNVEQLAVEVIRKQEELVIKEELRKAIAAEMSGLEEDVSKFELEIETLTREVEKTKGVQLALASKAEEVALLQVFADNASRTGTAILYNAQANPLKVAPGRTKIVLASMLGAFILCCLLVLSAKVMRTAS